MIGFDLSDITNVYVGSTPQSAIYLGSLLVWPKSHTSEYLTFELIEPSQFAVIQTGVVDLSNYNISYSTDNGSTWTNVMAQAGVTPAFPAGTRVLWKGNLSTVSTHSLPLMIFDNELYVNVSGRFNVSGNPSSLYFGDSFASSTTHYTWMFADLFKDNHYLVSATNLSLPLDTLSQGGYSGMFSGCTSLTTAPSVLPATTLAESCYNRMFYGCTSLTTAPALPATQFEVGNVKARHCYSSMFQGCTSLTTAPALPATTLAESCYDSMFQGCTSLTSAPILPATSLVVTPAAIDGTINTGVYNNMFQGCTSLTTAPALPATTLSDQCYAYMFSGCTSLTTAPALPATTLTDRAYIDMFEGCTALTTAPELPATTLAVSCYGNMFLNCTSLTTAPTLPATTLANYCYQGMFFDCSSLSSITCLATNISATDCTANWLAYVANSGTFTKAASMTNWTTGADGIPSGWAVQDTDYSPNEYLTFETLESAAFTFNYNLNHSDPSVNPIYYSVDDGATWNAMNISIPTQPANTRILLKSDWLSRGASGDPGTFIATGRFNVTGNIMSLLDGDNFVNITTVGANEFKELFKDCINLVNARSLKLPATTLADYCYYGMFQGCTSLTTAPLLPATTLAERCYTNMFRSCTSLTTVPELPATTLTSNCYQSMFRGCTSLTTAPELPAITLINNCYNTMFMGCTLLSSVTCLATNISASLCTMNWVNGVAASGTFIKNASMTNWTTGSSGIPSGWTLQDAS